MKIKDSENKTREATEEEMIAFNKVEKAIKDWGDRSYAAYLFLSACYNSFEKGEDVIEIVEKFEKVFPNLSFADLNTWGSIIEA